MSITHLDLPSLELRRLQLDLICYYKIVIDNDLHDFFSSSPLFPILQSMRISCINLDGTVYANVAVDKAA